MSIESHHGGWPVTADFNAPASHESLAKLVVARRELGIAAFYMHDCPCAPSLGVCNCHNDFVGTFYIENGVAKAKPLTTLKINGVAYATRAIVPVGATFTIQVTGAAVDGEEAQFICTIPPTPAVEILLPFAAGATAAHTIEMPVPGMGTIGCWGRQVRPCNVSIYRPAP
jgi:hypothetical protein